MPVTKKISQAAAKRNFSDLKKALQYLDDLKGSLDEIYDELQTEKAAVQGFTNDIEKLNITIERKAKAYSNLQEERDYLFKRFNEIQYDYAMAVGFINSTNGDEFNKPPAVQGANHNLIKSGKVYTGRTGSTRHGL